jgi:hypothetical protein
MTVELQAGATREMRVAARTDTASNFRLDILVSRTKVTGVEIELLGAR